MLGKMLRCSANWGCAAIRHYTVSMVSTFNVLTQVQRSSLLTEFLVPREPKPQNDLEVETLKDKSRPAEAKVKPEKKKMEVELGMSL